jgi:HD-GYP domain-containing protein (c-di-GMP phosphodiesterase class II)
MDLETALEQIRENSGTQFNPDITEESIIALRESFYTINNH